jgi:AraC-like DNA-binding protein
MTQPLQVCPIEARIRAAAIARRKRLFTPRLPAPAPALTTAEESTNIPPIEIDRKGSPANFIEARCRRYGANPQQILDSSNRSAVVVTIRDQIIDEVRRAFPKLSLRQIGVHMGMQHKSIRASVERSGVELAKRKRNTVPIERIVALHNSGYCQKDIARVVGCGDSTVSKVLSQANGGKPTRKLITDYVARIEALFDEGMTLAAIADRFDFCPSAVSKLVNKMGWQRE